MVDLATVGAAPRELQTPYDHLLRRGALFLYIFFFFPFFFRALLYHLCRGLPSTGVYGSHVYLLLSLTLLSADRCHTGRRVSHCIIFHVFPLLWCLLSRLQPHCSSFSLPLCARFLGFVSSCHKSTPSYTHIPFLRFLAFSFLCSSWRVMLAFIPPPHRPPLSFPLSLIPGTPSLIPGAHRCGVGEFVCSRLGSFEMFPALHVFSLLCCTRRTSHLLVALPMSAFCRCLGCVVRAYSILGSVFFFVSAT